MDDTTSRQTGAIAAFCALHASGCFILPNPWDAGSAVYLQRLGFRALATTSAGFAFSRGWPDDVGAVPLGAMLAHVAEIAAATPLPVNADFQNAFAHDPQGVAENVALCVATGVAGLSVEDNTGDGAAPLYERALAVERVRAARAAIDASGLPVVLTARCEAWLVGAPDPLRESLDRLAAYAEAGADCLYAPGVRDAGEIEQLVRAVSPLPVNVLMSAPVPGLSFARLEALGVRRISVGSALARAAWGGFIRAAEALAAGSFDGLAGGASFDALNDAFRQ